MGPPHGSFGDGGFGSSGGRTPNPYAPSGSGGWGGGRTPNPYVAGGGKTPAWGSSKTPNPYAEGGRTPFHSSSQTPNPYAQEGGRTPGWGSSARTPNPYAATNKSSGSGPGWGGTSPTWGGTTPKPSSWNESSSAPANNGWASPAPPTSGGWGEPTWVSPSEIDANSYSINSKPPTECANARFQRSDASVCTHSRWTRVWSNDVQCSDASRNVCQSF